MFINKLTLIYKLHLNDVCRNQISNPESNPWEINSTDVDSINPKLFTLSQCLTYQLIV